MITLYRVDDGQNMHRFYHLRVEQTLFGGWALIREWGRIGSRRGQTLEEWFDDAEPAEVALQKLESAKRRKGYTLGRGAPFENMPVCWRGSSS